MPYCGPNEWVAPGTPMCETGTFKGKAPSLLNPIGLNADVYQPTNEPAPGSIPSTVTGTVPSYNSDTRVVQVGGTPLPVVGSPDALERNPGNLTPEKPNRMTVYEGQTYLDELIGRASGVDASPEDQQEFQTLVSALRQHTQQKLGTMSSIQTAWVDVLKEAASSGENALDILAGPSLIVDPNDPGKYTGPRTTTSTGQMTDGQIEEMASALGVEMLGRAPDAQQMQRIKQAVLAAQAKNPDVTTTTPNGPNTTVTSSGGYTAADAEETMRNIMSANPQYGDYQKATTLMDYMTRAISERPDV